MWHTQRLIGILRDHPPWPSLRNLMAFFAVGYAVYFYSLVSGLPVNKDLVVSEVFSLASLFMLLSVRFAYRTIHDVMRLDELEQLANTDELTGMFNRRAIMHLLEEEFWKARRFGFPLSVAMVDLDELKRINDTYHHTAGDFVLKNISAILTKRLRRIDVLGRYGGDEFLCILPSTTSDGAIAMGNRIRARVKSLYFEVIGPEELRLIPEDEIPDDGDFNTTVSVGVATLDSTVNSPQTLVMAADAALYDAKVAGKDHTCSTPESFQPSEEAA